MPCQRAYCSRMVEVSRVTRSKAEAMAAYDRMSRGYDRFAGRFEKRFREAGLADLAVQPGEQALELGYGTGTALIEIAEAAGATGQACGVDISSGMAAVASGAARRVGLGDRVGLVVGDAAALPYVDASFDAVFASFTLELFDTPEIPVVLGECRRVLRPGGRLGLVSMALPDRVPWTVHVYEWAHRHWPAAVDCRPIPTAELLEDAGFEETTRRRLTMWALPVDVVVSRSAGVA